MYPLLRVVYAILNLFSFSGLQRLGRILGSTMYYILKSRREVAYKNCEVIGFKDDAKRIVKSSFKHTFSAYMESFYSKRIDQKFIDEMVEVEHISGKPFEERGYFMVSAHFGGWELAPYFMTKKLCLKGAAVARKIKDKKVDEFLIKQRANSDMEYIHHRGATDCIKEHINKNHSIGVLLDHSSMAKDSMIVPLFGIDTSFIKGIPLLSVRRDYPILPIFVLRKDHGFKLIVYPVIMPNKTLKPKERAFDVAKKINETYEDIIKKYPDQWYLIHKRFKRIGDKNGNLVTGIYK
ncbi:MAG: hypothetical protein C0603_13145 [Denitrovibrio sp.]|nr:MAG: hypothetical protein C0603_13145 [Denitrovibrio sp.]